MDEALAFPRKAFPPGFLAKWDAALQAVFGETYKFRKQTNLNNGPHIKGLHVYKLCTKGIP